MHYRKLKKVPATGRVEEKMITSPAKRPVAIREAENDSVAAPVKARKYPQDLSGFPENNKHAYKTHSPGEIRAKIQPLKANVQKQVGQKRKMFIRQRGDGSVFLIFLFLFLGLGLLVTGIGMVLIGINAIIWWMILLGLVVAFLGLMPFLGMISLMSGDRYRPSPAYDESQKKSFLPDHQ